MIGSVTQYHAVPPSPQQRKVQKILVESPSVAYHTEGQFKVFDADELHAKMEKMGRNRRRTELVPQHCRNGQRRTTALKSLDGANILTPSGKSTSIDLRLLKQSKS